uniref:Major capsid protein n=1 Tax=Globodera pallida TaxID=36090 RepID=A0A183CSY4_GLOPA
PIPNHVGEDGEAEAAVGAEAVAAVDGAEAAAVGAEAAAVGAEAAEAGENETDGGAITELTDGNWGS